MDKETLNRYKPPTISVVIIAKNEARIIHTLESLTDQTVKPYEVIVVVDDVNDVSAKLAQKYFDRLPLNIVINKVPGVGGARMRGVEEAKGDVIAFIDADCTADKRWLENIAKAFSESRVMVLAGKVISMKSRDSALKAYGSNSGYDNTIIPQCQSKLRFAPTLNFALRREIINNIGNFDPWFSEGGEDLDFCIRLRKLYKNAIICYNPGVIVYHFEHRLNPWKSWRDGRSRAKAFLKHGKPVLSDALVSILSGLSLLGFLALLTLGSPKYAALVLAPSLLHRIYRTLNGVLSGGNLAENLIGAFITYIAHVSFLYTIITLSLRRHKEQL